MGYWKVLPPTPPFQTSKYKGFSKFIKGKQFLLRSRRSFRHQYRPHWLMSYFNVIRVIRHNMTCNVWHQSIWSIWVSKRPSGSQQSHPLIRFWLNNCLKIIKIEYVSEIFSLYEFWESFVFWRPKRWCWRKHFSVSLRLEIYVFGNLMV